MAAPGNELRETLGQFVSLEKRLGAGIIGEIFSFLTSGFLVREGREGKLGTSVRGYNSPVRTPAPPEMHIGRDLTKRATRSFSTHV